MHMHNLIMLNTMTDFRRAPLRAWLLAGLSAAVLLSPLAAHAQRRCGYLISAAKDDVQLIDKDASWTIRSPHQKAGPDAQGMTHLPSLYDKRYMSVSDDQRYGCACLEVETDTSTSRITKVLSGEGVPFKRCENDSALPKLN